jgi:NAD(P)-dependent dehydrogenase (short-subunit alcohol dehydrogenase family)
MRHEIPAMLRTGGGAIVNTSSAAGLRARAPGTAPYATAKHALQGLTKVAALDCAARGIRVNAVAPGPIDAGRARGHRRGGTALGGADRAHGTHRPP